jgi:hypothetical protein
MAEALLQLTPEHVVNEHGGVETDHVCATYRGVRSSRFGFDFDDVSSDNQGYFCAETVLQAPLVPERQVSSAPEREKS